MPFCQNCGTEFEANERFCRHCGASLAASVAGRQTVEPAPVPETAVRVLLNYISPTRFLVMVTLSSGLYLFYWFYLTWKQYRDHTGQEVFPVWHSLTQFVPIYGWFRVHAHVRAYKELMINSGVPNSLSPGWAVVIRIIASLLFLFGLPAALGELSQRPESALTILDLVADFGELSQRTVVVFKILNLVSTALSAGILLQVQGNLNRYWASLPEVISGGVPLVSAKISAVEIILLVVGLWIWFNTLMLFFGPTYQAGGLGA